MAAVTDVTELVAWQLAVELYGRVVELAARPEVTVNRRYCHRLTRAAAHAPRGIADAFNRRTPEGTALVRAAAASERELLDLIGEARRRGWIGDADRVEYEFLARRAIAAADGLVRYLERGSGG
jgi:hypothetical protein